MLIQTLKRLEAAGFVVRTSYAEVPPRADYSLAELSWSLSPIVKALDEWVEQHAKVIASAAPLSRPSGLEWERQRATFSELIDLPACPGWRGRRTGNFRESS